MAHPATGNVIPKEGERKIIAYKPVALDGGYGWIVVLGSFLIHFFADGFVYSFGVMAAYIVDEFKAKNAETSVVLALLTGLMLAAGPVASAICNRIGCRATTIIGAVIGFIGCASSGFSRSLFHLYITVGIIMGCGFGLMYCPAIVIVTVYFERYRSLATGITVCGAGLGTFVFPHIIDEIIKAWGWRTLLYIYSAVVLLCVPCGWLFRPPQLAPVYEVSAVPNPTAEFDEKSLAVTAAKDGSCENETANLLRKSTDSTESSESDITKDETEPKQLQSEESNWFVGRWRTIKRTMDLALFVDSVYLLFAVSNFLTSIGFNAPPMFMSLDANMRGMNGSWAVTMYGLANLIGRITFGFLCDRSMPCRWGQNCERNRLMIYGLTLMICGIGTSFVFLIEGELMYLTYCFFYGFTISSFVCLTSVVLVDLVGVNRITNAFGLLLFVQGLATFIGPPIAGYLFDLTQSYGWTFGFCGINLFLSGVILLAIPPFMERKIRNKQLSDS